MPTGDQRTNFADKRNLPQQRIKDTFFDYLADQLLGVTSRVWSNQRGVFGSAALGSAVDEISVTGLPVELLDGNGNILELLGTNGTSLKIENILAASYDIGARHVLIPKGVERNPRNDVINYDTWEDEIGETADPNSLVESAGQLDVIVDSIYEVGVSHAGRLATVYLKTPVSDVESIAIERNLTVTWDGTNNRILTSGLLGQPGGSASIVAVDYTVIAQGLTIRRNTFLSTLDPYAFIGTATGTGVGNAPTVSTTGQVDVSDGINPSLNEAYDNSGAGKRITVDDEAVELETPFSATGDDQNAQFRLVRFGNSDWMQFMLVMQIGDVSSIPICVLQKVRGVGGILENNATTASGSRTLTFTGGGVDLEDDGLRLNERWNLLLVTSGAASEQGLYAINAASIGTTTVDVSELQLTTPPAVWTAEAKTVSILQVQFMLAGSNIHPSAFTVLSKLEGTSLFLAGGEQDTRPFRIFGHGAVGNAIEYYDNAVRSDGDPNEGARLAGSYNPDQVGVAGGYVWNFGRPMKINAGVANGIGGEPASYARDALRLLNGGGDFNTLTPKLCLAIEDGNTGIQPAAGGFKGGLTDEMQLVRGHHFEDHFVYHPSTWLGNTVALGLPSHYATASVGAASIVHAKTNLSSDGCGAAQLESDTANGDSMTLEGPLFMRILSTRGFQWLFQALVNVEQITNCKVTVGLLEPNNSDLDAVFEFEAGVNGDKWQFIFRDDTGSLISIDTGLLAVAGKYVWMSLHQVSYSTWIWGINHKGSAFGGLESVGPGTGGNTNFGDATTSHIWKPSIRIETIGTPGSRRLVNLDYWLSQDVGNPIYSQLRNTIVD